MPFLHATAKQPFVLLVIVNILSWSFMAFITLKYLITEESGYPPYWILLLLSLFAIVTCVGWGLSHQL